MNKYAHKSQLKSNTIKKAWLNRKDYKYLDFDFKFCEDKNQWNKDFFYIDTYNCGVKILRLGVSEQKQIQNEERFSFEVEYFNPKTDNDCNSINHILAVCSECVSPRIKHRDRGNADIIKNQFIFRKKKNYYSYTRIWVRGKIEEDNYDKQLSYEFATNEYLNYIKDIFDIKKIQRRKIKKHFKGFLDKIILLERL